MYFITVFEWCFSLILDDSFNCKTLEEKLKHEYSILSNLPYESMNNQLLAKSVLTCDEKLVIDREIGTKQMSKVLDIIIRSLKLNQITKFEGFLEAMEESDDTALKETAKKLKALGKWDISFNVFAIVCEIYIHVYVIKYT